MRQTYLWRYTDIPALVYLLSKRKITLLDPRSWDDTNDSHYLSVYKKKRKLTTVLALCFANGKETYHHWKVFSGNPSGVCMKFNRSELLKNIEKREGIKSGDVEYFTLKSIRIKKPVTDQLPFIKRIAFEDENEFRVIYESKTNTLSKLDIKIPLTCIAKITLSPWMHKSLAEPFKRILKSIDYCNGLEIVRSTLIGNVEWKEIGGSSA